LLAKPAKSSIPGAYQTPDGYKLDRTQKRTLWLNYEPVEMVPNYEKNLKAYDFFATNNKVIGLNIYEVDKNEKPSKLTGLP